MHLAAASAEPRVGAPGARASARLKLIGAASGSRQLLVGGVDTRVSGAKFVALDVRKSRRRRAQLEPEFVEQTTKEMMGKKGPSESRVSRELGKSERRLSVGLMGSLAAIAVCHLLGQPTKVERPDIYINLSGLQQYLLFALRQRQRAKPEPSGWAASYSDFCSQFLPIISRGPKMSRY